MKKKAIKALLATLAIILAVQIAIPVLAATKTYVTWDTSGQISITVQADDDATTILNTAGNHIFGEFNATDHDDNPYGYNVDTFDTWLQAQIEDGGFIEWQTSRLDSWTRMYGEAGQISYTYIETDDYGFVKFKTNTNYASLRNCEYGFQSDNQFVANGSYFIVHQLTDSDGEGMYVLLTGNGEGKITVMNGEALGSSWKLGRGCGCFTNAKASASGSGYFEASGWASNYLQSDLGFTLPNGGAFTISIDFNEDFSIDNFASEGE